MKFYNKKIFFQFIFFTIAVLSYSQTNTNVDSLLKVLKKTSDNKKPEIYLKIADGYLYRKNYEEAIGCLNNAVKIAAGDENNEVMMKVYYSLGDNYMWKDDFEKSFKSLSRSLEIAKAINEKSFQIDINLLFAYGYQFKMEYDKSIEYLNIAIELAGSQESSKVMSKVFYVRGRDYMQKGNIEKALKDYFKALEIAKKINDIDNQSIILNNIGVAYKTMGEYQKAIEYFQINLKTQETLGDSAEIGKTLNNIGNVYFSFGIFSKAIEYYEKSLQINMKLKAENYVGYLLMNIGIQYARMKENTKALEYLKKSFDVFQKIGLKKGMAQVQSELGSIFAEEGKFKIALKYQEDALKVYMDLGEKMNAAMSLKYLASTYYKSGNYSTALTYYKQSLNLEKQIGMKKEMVDNFKEIADVYAKMGDFNNAFNNSKIYSSLKDSMLGEDYLKQIQELNAKYETDKKEKEIQLQKSELSKKELEAKRKNMVLIGVGFITLIILFFTFITYKQYTEKKRANVLLAEQNDEIKKQRDQIFQQKKEITDSIHYASRIQRAVLPSPKIIEDIGLQYFILYKPRDIVSGDFYWINQRENKILIAAADCTGHGVPGAFMSMLGMALLNEIVGTGEFQSPGQILNELRNLVIKSLHQSGKIEEAKDGMDIALCMIDVDKDILQFAGAFNPLYLIRKGEIQEASADHMPVGFHDKLDVPFTNSELKLQKDDLIYIFSDGYVDQFGGESGKKFMAKKFKQLLLSMQNMSMDQQREYMDKTITDWRGELDQVDDIMVIGLRV